MLREKEREKEEEIEDDATRGIILEGAVMGQLRFLR
jgi:hypothetical protein